MTTPLFHASKANPPPAASPNAMLSPRSSRDSSPAPFVPSSGTSASAGSRGMRSRKNSHEVSPARQPNPLASTVPSAAAIQRALSGAGVPQLQPTTGTGDASSSRIPRSQRANGDGGKDSPSWPTSPRLKSPSPSSSSRKNSLLGQRRPAENGTPNIVLQRVATDPPSDPTSKEADNSNSRSTNNRIAPALSTLETVQESSAPVTPDDRAKDSESSNDKHSDYFNPASDEDRPVTAKRSMAESSKAGASSSRGEMSPTRKVTTSTSIAGLEPKSLAEPALKNMTVETETVSSIPQVTLAPNGNGRSEASGTLRVKASNETIRPKKDRKKASKKAPPVNAAPPSTRSEVFENRVKKEMDDAASDDSDETFVYESNPPDPPPQRSKHHSRTPSGASLASMQDRGITRSIAATLDKQKSLQKPRSMKFSSNTSNYGTADEDADYLETAIRPRDRNGTHQTSRHSRTATGQSSLLDDENPLFPLMPKTKSLTAVGGRSSNAVRLAAQQLRAGSVKRSDGYSSLDMEAEAADDERTPLMNPTGSVRTPGRSRNNRSRGYRYSDLRLPPPRRNMLARLIGCLLILVTVSLLIIGVVCFLFALSAPLKEISVLEINDVIASETELMMDLVVEAMNPNLVPITISDLDIYVFAKSKYVGSEKWWREHGREPAGNDTDALIPSHSRRSKERLLRRRPLSIATQLDPGIIISDPPTEPPSQDPDEGKPTMLLGDILKFDNPLVFDGSFWRRQPHTSVGSLRLSKPGNRTEAGGTERWERVLKHDFDIQIRGVLTYTIPLTGRVVNAGINGITSVKGNGGKDDDGDEDDDDDDDF